MMKNTMNNIRTTKEYHDFYFDRSDTYSGFDKETQERWNDSCLWFDTYGDGVYKD